MTLSIPDPVRWLPARTHRARRLAVVLLILIPFFFGALAVWLGQDANWDLRNYHWYNAYAALNGRYSLDMLPSQTPWFYNPALDIPFYVLATHLPAVAVGFTLGFIQGLNFILLFMLAYASLTLANPRHKVLLSATLALMGMLGGGGIAQIGTVFYDNITSLGLLLSALLVVRYHEKLMTAAMPHAMGLALLFGIPSGMAMGCKLPSFTFCFGLCAALLFTTGDFRRRFMAAFAFGIGILVGVGITLGPWAWFLQTHFGSPLFPYFNNFFQSPLAPLSSARDMQYVPRNLHDFLLFPFIIADSPFRAGEIPFRDWRLVILYVLLPLAVVSRLIFGRSRDAADVFARPHAQRYLTWVAALAYAAWLIMFGIYRYAVLLEMLAPLLIVFAVGLLPLRPAPRAMLAGFILLVAAASVQPGNWGRRNGFNEHFIMADIPPLGDTANTMLLMAGFEPYAHLATMFPPDMPVVRIQSNFVSPDQDKPFNKLLHDKVDAHKGRFLILIPTWQHGMADEALSYYNLRADWKTCQTVKDRLFEDTVFDLCSVTRK